MVNLSERGIFVIPMREFGSKTTPKIMLSDRERMVLTTLSNRIPTNRQISETTGLTQHQVAGTLTKLGRNLECRPVRSKNHKREIAKKAREAHLIPKKATELRENPLDDHPRKVKALYLVSLGLTNKRIGERLGISLSTVGNTFENINAILGTHSKLEALVKAYKLGIIHPDKAKERKKPEDFGLTPQEAKAFKMVLRGKSNKDISTSLKVTVKRIEKVLQKIYLKIGGHSRREAFSFALKNGLLIRDNLPKTK